MQMNDTKGYETSNAFDFQVIGLSNVRFEPKPTTKLL